jgi:hypothetical protein
MLCQTLYHHPHPKSTSLLASWTIQVGWELAREPLSVALLRHGGVNRRLDRLLSHCLTVSLSRRVPHGSGGEVERHGEPDAARPPTMMLHRQRPGREQGTPLFSPREQERAKATWCYSQCALGSSPPLSAADHLLRTGREHGGMGSASTIILLYSRGKMW